MTSTFLPRPARCAITFALLAFALLSSPTAQAQDAGELPDYVVAEFGTPPAIPEGPLSAALAAALDTLVGYAIAQADWDASDLSVFDTIEQSGDPRVAWLLTDMLRFTWRGEFHVALSDTTLALLEIDVQTLTHRGAIIDHLMAWDMPAYTGYLDHKRVVFTNYVPGWDRIFVEGDIDWHLV